jgi:hypothetical protein
VATTLFGRPLTFRGGLLGTALGLALTLGVVYARSMPPTLYVESPSGNSLARVLGKEPYFESDGAFIVRQFRQQRTFTHNDHVLYHVLARTWHRWSGGTPADAVAPHLALSIVAGALGASLLVIAGYQVASQLLPALLSAGLVGGAASYWFFASTIDTYLPSLLFSILALSLAVRCVDTQRLGSYAAMGAAAGVAFLLRTDAILLAPLIVVAVQARRGRIARVAICGLAAALVGGGGYALLAHYAYDVPYSNAWSWATASLHRPQASLGIWASTNNLSMQTLGLTLANHLVYGVVLPGLDMTRVANVLDAGRSSSSGSMAFVAYVALCAVALVRSGILASASQGGRTRLLLGVAALWLLARIGFYAWWNPHDPFLFAVMSVPALWLLWILPFSAPGRTPRSTLLRLTFGTLALAVPLVWWHNFQVLIGPVWTMPVPD